MAQHRPPDPDFESKVRDSFARQAVMGLIGAHLTAIEAGRCGPSQSAVSPSMS